MRRLLASALLLTAACAELPATDTLAGHDDPFGERGFSVVPDGAVHPRPATVTIELAPTAPEPDDVEPEAEEAEADAPYAGPPRIVVTRWDDTLDEQEDRYWADGTARCPFEVQALGLPAVDDDGTTLAWYSREMGGASEGEDEIASVRMVDLGSDVEVEKTVLVDGNDNACWRWYKRARARAAELNERFADGWRPLEQLGVQPHGTGQAYGYDELDEPEVPYTPHTRPVQLTWMHDEVVLRIPAVKVLARSAAAWQIPADDPDVGGCWYDAPAPTQLWVDRQTGASAVFVEHISGPCYCDSYEEMHAFAIGAEAILEIDRRNAAL